jgi:antitoxin component YwqK of YwqJK toxin-antitoxin module
MHFLSNSSYRILYQRGAMKEDKLNGKVITYNREGRIATEQTYQDGQEVL